MQFRPKPGGCLCGALRYRLIADPVVLYACHCTDCQTATGTAFALSMIVERDAIEVTRGEAERRDLRLDAKRTRRSFSCSACQTRLWSAPVDFPNLLNLQPGTLDDTSWLAPAGHIWTRSAQPWLTIPEGVLRYEGQVDDILPMVRAWKSRAG